MVVERGFVQPDGSSVTSTGDAMLPAGVQDLVAIGNETKLDQELEEHLQSLFDAELTTDENKARFKLEVVFSEERSKMKPFAGMLFAWTNGGYAHGGGDEVVYFCSGKVDHGGVTKTCNAPIDLKFVSREHAVCATCKQVLKPQELTGQVFARLTAQHWATLLVRVFLLLEANADIRIGMMPGDLRRATEFEQGKDVRGEVLNRVRAQRAWVRYPLVSIIKDTSNGASLYRRIRTFLEA